jgi:hypothetical protein
MQGREMLLATLLVVLIRLHLQQVLQVCWDLATNDRHINLAARHCCAAPSCVLHLKLHHDLPVLLLEALCIPTSVLGTQGCIVFKVSMLLTTRVMFE